MLNLQKRCVRVITKSHYIAHSNPLFLKLGKLKVTDIFRIQVASFVYNSMQMSNNSYVNSYFNRFKFQPVLRRRARGARPTARRGSGGSRDR